MIYPCVIISLIINCNVTKIYPLQKLVNYHITNPPDTSKCEMHSIQIPLNSIELMIDQGRFDNNSSQTCI